MTRPIFASIAASLILAATACHGGPSSSFVPQAPLAPQSAALAPDAVSPIKLSSKSLAFPGTGTALVKTITATESKYTGLLLEKNTCAHIATIAPPKHKGPKAKFKVTPIGKGTCSITITDKLKHKAIAKVAVTITNPALNPTTLSFDQSGATAALPFTAAQTGFSGAFKESDNCSGIASVAASSWSGPSANANVTPLAAGTCTITVSNGIGGTSQIAVSVTTSGIIIQ